MFQLDLQTVENRRNLTCNYSRPRSRNGIADPLWNVSPVNDGQADVQPIDYPTILFLDPGLLQHGQVEISQITTTVPAHVLHLLGDLDEIRGTAATFFEYPRVDAFCLEKNASTSCTCAHRSNSGQTLPFSYPHSSSLQRYLPRHRGTLGPRCIMP